MISLSLTQEDMRERSNYILNVLKIDLNRFAFLVLIPHLFIYLFRTKIDKKNRDSSAQAQSKK